MKKLLILTDADFIGGAETNYKYILPQLLKNGWSPVFITTGGTENMKGYFANQGMEAVVIPAFTHYFSFSVNNRVSFVNIFRTWLAILTNRKILKKLAQEYQPAAIVSNSMVSHWLLSTVTTGPRCRKIMHLHDIINTNKAFGLYGRGLNNIAGKMDAIITVSGPVRNQLSARLQSRAKLIYNPAEASPFTSDNKSRRVLTIGMFARYTPWKGHRDFLAIAKAFPLDRYQFTCFGNYAGNEAYYEELRQIAARLPNSKNIHLNGFCYNTAEEMAKCDIILQLSLLPDASPKIMAEGNLCHVPIYAYEGGGVGEQFNALSLAGKIVACGDTAAMVAAIKDFPNQSFVFPDLTALQPATYFSKFEQVLC